jgi:hypothetical protein
LVFGVEAETTQVYEEARSVLATVFGQLLAMVRSIVNFLMKISAQLFTYISEHPLAATLAICNVMIWVSP